MKREQIGFRAWQFTEKAGDFYHAEIDIMRLEPRFQEKKPGFLDTKLFTIAFIKSAGEDARPDANYFIFRLEVDVDATAYVHPLMQRLGTKINKLKGLEVSNEFDRYLWACRQIFTEVWYDQDEHVYMPLAA